MRIDVSAAREGCGQGPSDRTLDAYRLGALDEAGRAAVDAHAAGCAACARRLAEVQAGFAAFPALDERAVLGRVQAAYGGRRRPWRWLLLAPVAAAALVLVWIRPPAEGPEPPGPTVLTKGAAALRVFRQSGHGPAEEMLSGQAFRAGDRVRFLVDLPGAGTVRIYGVDGRGRSYVAWPPAGAGGLPAGRGQELPGAVELDDAPGPETLHLVHCPGARAAPACTAGAAGIDCPKGCTRAAFVVRKE
jgi:hypothetical protein